MRRKILLVVLVAFLAMGGYIAWRQTRPRGVDDRIDPNVKTVPPPGVAPFDPKPLMDKVVERIKSDKFRFAVLGDSKNAKTLPAFIEFLEQTVKPDFVLSTGDMVERGGGSIGPGWYQQLSKECGDSMRKIPWWPAIGNHEIAGNPVITGNPEKEELTLTDNQKQGVANFKSFYNLADDHYVFTLRNCCFIALPFPQPFGAQIPWLEGEMKKAVEAKQHIFIFNHMPYYTCGQKGADDIPNKETPLTALFKKYNVCAVFSGHDHGYYRTVRNGIPYFISAGGGAGIYPCKRVAEALPEDVYYFGDPATYGQGKSKSYILHKGGSTPDKITSTPDQFMCVVDVDGDKINCFTVTVKNEKWDEIQLNK